jgi:hypothetical protein
MIDLILALIFYGIGFIVIVWIVGMLIHAFFFVMGWLLELGEKHGD